jgi:hypothetical protein
MIFNKIVQIRLLRVIVNILGISLWTLLAYGFLGMIGLIRYGNELFTVFIAIVFCLGMYCLFRSMRFPILAVIYGISGILLSTMIIVPYFKGMV